MQNILFKPKIESLRIHFLLAGVLMGMSNSFATIPGFLGPEIVGVLTEKHVCYNKYNLCQLFSNLRMG